MPGVAQGSDRHGGAIHRSNGTAERASAPFAHPVAYRFFCEGEYRHMSAISKSRLLATSAIAGLSILHMVVPAPGAEHGRLLPDGEPASVDNPGGETIDGIRTGVYSRASQTTVTNAGTKWGNGRCDSLDTLSAGRITLAGWTGQ